MPSLIMLPWGVEKKELNRCHMAWLKPCLIGIWHVLDLALCATWHGEAWPRCHMAYLGLALVPCGMDKSSFNVV